MRKFILIAGFVLASAAAQAGDQRSLSLGRDVQAAPAKASAPQTAQVAEPPKAEAAPAADTPKADAPKYVERPAIVKSKPNRFKDEPRVRDEAKYRDQPRYRNESRYRDEGRYTPSRKYAGALRYDRPRKRHFGIRQRILSALHRHGIYW